MTRKIALSVLLLAFLSYCRKDVSVYEGRTVFFENTQTGNVPPGVITCVTWNIHLGFGSSGNPWDASQKGGSESQLRMLADVIIRSGADIVCLQEVPLNRYNTGVKDFIRVLARETGMNCAFGSHGYNDPEGIVPVKGEWGNAILSKFEIAGVENTEVERRSVWEKRSVLKASLKYAGSYISVYSVHFLPSEQAIPGSLNLLVKDIAYPQIIMGDFNMTNAPALTNTGYVDCMHHDTLLRFAIDRIYVSGNRAACEQVAMIPESTGLSDHPAVAGKIRLY